MSGVPLEARRLLLIQLGLGALLGIGFALFGELASAGGAAFGGFIAMSNTWLMGRTVASATEVAKTQPGSETRVLMVGALTRFTVVAMLFAAAIGAMQLPPVQVIVGFAVVHGAYFLARVIVAMPPEPEASRDSKGG